MIFFLLKIESSTGFIIKSYNLLKSRLNKYGLKYLQMFIVSKRLNFQFFILFIIFYYTLVSFITIIIFQLYYLNNILLFNSSLESVYPKKIVNSCYTYFSRNKEAYTALFHLISKIFILITKN